MLDHSLSLKQFEKAALQRGLDLRYQIRAMQFIRQENGRVTGVIAINKEGKYIQFNARKAIILCTGDYGNNPWMMQKYAPHVADAALENNIYMVRNEDLRVAPEPLDTGDGFQMAMRIGAVMQHSLGAGIVHATSGTAGNAPFLRVNIEGVRYENEDVPAPSISCQLQCQPGKTAWQIFDSKWESEIPLMGIGLGKYYPIKDTIRNQVETQSFKANTIEELAKLMNVPVKTFKAEVDRYNRLAKNGKDLDFSKRADRMTVIEKPPFYASKSKYEFLAILGGLNCNMRQQPLDAKRQVIPGLYLAGNSIGNRYALDYPTMCPGMTHNMAYLSGKFAGQFAAAEQA